MKRMQQRQLALFGLLAGFLIGCSTPESITIDGSSTVYPITEAVAEEYRKEQPDVRVTVGFSGTGGGVKKFIAGSIDHLWCVSSHERE